MPKAIDGVTRRYADALRALPPSGGGGAHAALLSVANFGKRAGLDAGRIAADLRAHAHGTRKITDREIWDAVEKAFLSEAPALRAAPHVRVNDKKLLDHIFARGAGFTEERLREVLPVRIDWRPEEAAVEILRRLYNQSDKLFIGEKLDPGAGHIHPAAEWIYRFQHGEPVPPHIIPNPLNGQRGLTKDNKPSLRADSCVSQFRFATIEFDAMPLDQQILFWAGALLPVVALIHSGSKSIHAWVRIDATDADEWTRCVECRLFSFLKPVNVDSTSKNEARLSRMSGFFRREKISWQRILYLALEGRPVMP
jgi:hypothetical protein